MKKWLFSVLLALSVLSITVPALAMILPGSRCKDVHMVNVEGEGPCMGMSWHFGGTVIRRGDCIVRVQGSCDWNGVMCSCDWTVTEVLSDGCWDEDFEEGDDWRKV